jgi:hypothetical protein
MPPRRLFQCSARDHGRLKACSPQPFGSLKGCSGCRLPVTREQYGTMPASRSTRSTSAAALAVRRARPRPARPFRTRPPLPRCAGRSRDRQECVLIVQEQHLVQLCPGDTQRAADLVEALLFKRSLLVGIGWRLVRDTQPRRRCARSARTSKVIRSVANLLPIRCADVVCDGRGQLPGFADASARIRGCSRGRW